MNNHVDPTVDAGLREAAMKDAIDLLMGRAVKLRLFGGRQALIRRHRTHLSRFLEFARKLEEERSK